MPFGLGLLIESAREEWLSGLFKEELADCRARRKAAILRAWKASA